MTDQLYNSLANTFKVNAKVVPNVYYNSRKLKEWSKPKFEHKFRGDEKYRESDYRGLLHPDFSESIKKLQSKPKTAEPRKGRNGQAALT